MKNFLIGMYGGFNTRKFERDFKYDFWGVEACMFPGEEEVHKLVREANEKGFRFGVHYPLIKKDTTYRDPFLISLNKEEKEDAWAIFEKETAFAASKGADYILTHIPKPVLVDRSLDLKYWRFTGHKEWVFTDGYPIDVLEDNLSAMFEWLSKISNKYAIQIVLENEVISSILTETNLLLGLFEKHKQIKFCLDIGRLHLQETLDPAFNAKSFAETFASYTYLVHLWNSNFHQNLTGGHYPVLPTQQSSDGWADVKTYMETIIHLNRDVLVLFEHNSGLISDEELDMCYQWVDQMFST